MREGGLLERERLFKLLDDKNIYYSLISLLSSILRIQLSIL